FFVYGVLVWQILGVATRARDNFSKLFAAGFAVILISQFFINIGMNLSMLPVVGIYLPFISYGGSGLIFNFIALGILQSLKTGK
ncbi:MAG TPA: FtsW/RodA/SpoVE family cell cycle protein, partial [Candidatus Staskawiczbacteria bacterium]|nr:FtsW/RodA/SpoVE family cell cycle protein [Candidatus Staskawiczbacteria bacterium]